MQSSKLPTLFAYIAILTLSGCTSPNSQSGRVKAVSLVELLANPEKYHGMKISVSGFYHKEIENSALYLSRDDARYGIDQNSAFIGDPEPHVYLSEFNNSFVTIWGRVNFDAQGSGHLGLLPVAILEIDRISKSPVSEDIP